jgi:hypothetical protein
VCVVLLILSLVSFASFASAYLVSMNPLAAVRATCSQVVQHSKHVTIVDSAIEEHASKFGDSVVGFGSEVEWDAQGWHYCKDVGEVGPLTVQFIFVMDALNFCFWPSPRFEYDTLAVSLKEVLEKDPSAFNADKLACMTEVQSSRHTVNDQAGTGSFCHTSIARTCIQHIAYSI